MHKEENTAFGWGEKKLRIDIEEDTANLPDQGTWSIKVVSGKESTKRRGTVKFTGAIRR